MSRPLRCRFRGFSKGAATERIWFYDMEHDGFSLDDKRQPTPGDNDIPDVLDCWQHRGDAKFQKKRDARLAELREQIAPLKKERLEHHALIHRLRFEEAISPQITQIPADSGNLRPSANSCSSSSSGNLRPSAKSADSLLSAAESELAALNQRIAPLQKEINQLTRQFWVAKDQVVAQNHDLSASRYRQIEQDEVFHEKPAVTLERLRALEQAAEAQVKALEKMLMEEDGSAD